MFKKKFNVIFVISGVFLNFRWHGQKLIKTVREARKSFLSGHASFSFYSAVFLVLYLQIRLSNTQGFSKPSSLRSRIFEVFIKHDSLWSTEILRGQKTFRACLGFTLMNIRGRPPFPHCQFGHYFCSNLYESATRGV